MKIKVKIKGKSPLLLHRFAGEEDDGSKKRKKVYVPEEEAEKALYVNEAGKTYVPTLHFKAAMVKAGVDFPYKGRKTYKDYIKSGIFFEQEDAVLTPQKYEIFKCPVVVAGARIIRCRPMFKDWSCEFVFEIINDDIKPQVVKEILADAGKFKGVGDSRPEYGRFEIAEFKKI